MKPVNVDGRPIYPSIFLKLESIGNRLVKLEWRESYMKPNLFLKSFDDVMVFADMRGTEITPIWEEPYPLIYASPDRPDWKRRYSLHLATDELGENDIQYRFSWPDQFEPDGLFFGPENELTDGYCKMCGKHITEQEREGNLFCSSHCETAFSQLINGIKTRGRATGIKVCIMW